VGRSSVFFGFLKEVLSNEGFGLKQLEG